MAQHCANISLIYRCFSAKYTGFTAQRRNGSPTQQTRGIHPMLFQCWASVEDGGPTLKRHWGNARVCWV